MENFEDGFRDFRSYVVSSLRYAGVPALDARDRQHRDGAVRDAGGDCNIVSAWNRRS